MEISIITPTFNRADCLVRCLDSVTNQLRHLPLDLKVEQVVVDDGSLDNTRELLARYAADHPHVVPVYFDCNRGVNAARNAAVRKAAYRWCLILDSDDALNPGALDRIAGVVEAEPGYRSYMFTVDDRIEEMAAIGDRREYVFEDFLLGRADGDFAHLLDRQLLLDHPFDENLRIYEGLFFLSFFKDAGRMLFTNIVTHRRERDRSDSVSLTLIRTNDAVIRRKLQKAEMQLERFGEDYISAGHPEIVSRLYFEIADNSTLLGEYVRASQALPMAGDSMKTVILKFIIALRLGVPYKWMLQRYLLKKYRKPERGVN